MLPVQRVGCTHISSWTYGVFNEKTKSHHINILKLYPISLAVFLFSKSWHNKNILFICNNLASIARLLMMKLIRIIVLHALEHNFCIRPKHIPTAHNTACDLLSRFQVENALRLAPHLDPLPLPIPHHVSPSACFIEGSSSKRHKHLRPALRAYFLVRGDQNGTLFVSSLSSPFSFVKFRSVFKELLVNGYLTPYHYKLHSFRIAALLGVSDTEIMRMGRWRSNGFRRYIRLPNISTVQRFIAYGNSFKRQGPFMIYRGQGDPEALLARKTDTLTSLEICFCPVLRCVKFLWRGGVQTDAIVCGAGVVSVCRGKGRISDNLEEGGGVYNCKGSLYGQRYRYEILGPHVFPFLRQMNVRQPIYQDDNAKPHMAAIVNQFV
ncbi:hypothetical protein MAR_008465 [Mya arenaria]|uniref:Uncharacterized protein n=1 Tax=Mya arenaria TaxID=6604 RepID=A0ABY7DYN5_MYAAR|nr:hypothetical protein MAR_008465 [Mya arenaria]